MTTTPSHSVCSPAGVVVGQNNDSFRGIFSYRKKRFLTTSAVLLLSQAPIVTSFVALSSSLSLSSLSSCRKIPSQPYPVKRCASSSPSMSLHSFHESFAKPRGNSNSSRPPATLSLLPLAASTSDTDNANNNNNNGDLAELKSQLTMYLKTREEQIRTKAPGTEEEDSTDVFNYAELMKYGYGRLVQPMMDNGGRGAMYRLMEMTPPPSLQMRSASRGDGDGRVRLDQEEADEARFRGLNAAMDDESIGRALEQAQERSKQDGVPIQRKKLREEQFVRGSATQITSKSSMTPAWTPERMDEEARRAGQRYSWARRAREEQAEKRDKDESILVEGGLRWYSAFVAVVVSLSFGQSTPAALRFLEQDTLQGVQEVGQYLALSLVLGAIGSSIVASVVLAPPKNRSSVVWAVKGLLGGPLAIVKLRELTVLEENTKE